MDKLSKSLEILKVLSTSASEASSPGNEKSRLDPITISKEKLHHLNSVTELLCSPALMKGTNDNYFKLLTASVETLFSHCDENDHDVRLAVEENINKLVKNLKETQLARIQVELHRVIKRNPNIGPRALKGALWRFAELANVIHPKKIRAYFEHLFAAFCSIAARPEDIVHDKLADYYELIFRILGPSIGDKEIKELLLAYLVNMSHESALIRRSSAACIIIICRHFRYPLAIARFLITFSIDQLLVHYQQSESLRLINGYLGLIKNLVQLLGSNIEELLDNAPFQSSLNTNKSPDPNEQHLPINVRQLIECVDMVCYLCLHHSDHNVVSSSLETLEILLKYSYLFDLDQLLLATKVNASISETRVSQALKTAIPTYQRSFIDHTEQQQLSTDENNDELEGSSTANLEKRTSAARLVEQLTSKYILNIDGAIKGDDASRVSIKCATLTCLAHLSTIDPFAFFDSFDYPSEIITYLLSLREHNDPQLRGAFANLLAKLVQTTVRLLTISPPISSLSSSFLNQCSLTSTDSQDSSRLDIQLGILAELLSTFRSCLNDHNSRVIHVSLTALRTLLPILFHNSNALSILAMELLDDALQHTTNAYVLTKVALAQLIGDVDFRILAYLEQQLQPKRTNRPWLERCIDITFQLLHDEDTRVRQVAALTFARFVDQSSFLPCQWPIHSLLKWINDSCQWVYTVHHSLQPSSPTSIISNDEVQCETISCLSSLVFDRLAQATTRTRIIGCLEGISALANILKPKTIRFFFHNQYDELRFLIHFFKHPFVLHDLNNLQLLLDILQVLFSNLVNYSYDMVDVQSTEKVFHFLIKILSIFACVVDETTPPAPPASKINFPQIPGSPKQLKNRFESNKDDSKNEKESLLTEGSNPMTSSKDSSTSVNLDKEKKSNRTQLGAFGNNPSMMKLFELIRSSYQTFKTSLSSTESDRFSQLLSTTLACMRSVLNLVSIQDMSKHLDETLNYLKSTFNVEKTKSIQCTQEFLQSLHQLSSHFSSPSQTKPAGNNPSLSTNNTLTNIHTITIRQPMIYLFGSRHSLSVNSDQPIENSPVQELYLSRKQRNTINYLKRPPNRTERAKIDTFIRSFEMIVILALKKYVNSNETEFQAAVLDLLVQLLLLRVNYSLLDADEQILKYITKQLELIEEHIAGFDVSSNFIYRIAEFLVMLSHDTLHSKQVIKVQDLIKHCDLLLASGQQPEIYALSALEPVVYDLFLVRSKTDNQELEAQRMVIVQSVLKLVRYNKGLQLLTVIVDSVRNETDKWKRLSRQVVDVLLVHLQSNVSSVSVKDQSLLDIYSTQLTLFDVVSTVALRPIDPFVVAFRTLANRNLKDCDRPTINRWFMNINIILRCVIQNSNEDALIARWKDGQSTTSETRDENFSAALLRILHDVVLQLLSNTRLSRGQVDMTLVALTSDYLYLLMHIVENAKQFRSIVHDLRQLLIHDEGDETVHRLDSFSYLTVLSDYFKLLSSFSISLLLQWTHLLNVLDYTHEAWWSSMLSIPTPSSLITHLSLTGQLQSYCDLICRHELYVEHLTSITTHRHLLMLLVEQSDTCTYVHNLFGLIHRTNIASHLFIESIYTNCDHLFKRNQLLVSLKILRTLENIHLDESGFLLVLLIEQFLTLPYLAVLRLAELIICRRIEIMLTFDEQTLAQQLMPKYLPSIVHALSTTQNQSKSTMKSNEHLWALVQRLVTKIDTAPEMPSGASKEELQRLNTRDEDFILNWIRKVQCPLDITPKMYAQMLKVVTYKKLLPFMMSPDFIWSSMPHCLVLGIDISPLWRASTSALVKKINDLCFSLPTQRLITDTADLHEEDSTPDTIYIKSLLTCAEQQPYLIALIDSLTIYFDTVEQHTNLASQLSLGDTRDLLRLIIFVSEIIYINLVHRKSAPSWAFIESFFRCLTKTIQQTSAVIYQTLSATDQIISCCMLAKTVLAIFDHFYQRHGVINLNKRAYNVTQAFLNLIEPDHRPLTHVLLRTFEDLDRLYHSTKQIRSLPHFYRHYLRTVTILLFRLPIFNSFVRVPAQFWEQNDHDFKKLQFASQDFCLSSFPVDLLQHSDIMADYSERISLVGWLSRTQFQEIWVTFLAAINPPSSNNQQGGDENLPATLSKEEILETNATQCVWVRGVTTFLLNALRLNGAGNPADPDLEHRCRNKTIPFLSTDIGGQYIQTRARLEISSDELFTNIERLGTRDQLFYGQLSYDTILASIQSNNASPLPVNSLFDRLFSRHGLDLTSSLQILIEIYVRWLTTNPNSVCLQLKYELLRSFVYLSDLFTSTQQLTNLHEICDDYLRSWPDEDDLMISLISHGLCKSSILLGHTNKEANELYQRLIERNFKFISKTTAYASCLFLLESNEEDVTKSLMTFLNQELTSDISNNNLKTNLDIRLNGLVLSNLFFLIENNQQSSLDMLTTMIKDDSLDGSDHLTAHMVSLGLERLLLLGQYPKNEVWRLYKRSITILRQSLWFDSDHLALIFARLYTSLKATNENASAANADQLNDEQEMTDSLTMNSSSDNIIIELVGEFYERIKQSYTLPYEAVLLLRPLPSLLAHYGLSDRLMNKMVVEFAAFNQHLYPQILAYTIFAVFRGLIQANHAAKVNEWTLLSMNSVAQRKPIRMAIWGLTCLMLSACPSHDIANALFPLALSRFSARFEELDNRLFLLAGREYYHQLTNMEQRHQFEQAFTNETNAETLYNDLIAHLRDTTTSSSS